MCMEDVRIGRAMKTGTVRVSVGTASQLIVPTAPNRFSIIILPPPSGVVHFSPGVAAIFGEGLMLTPASPPFVLDVEHFGQLVTGPWFGITDVGAQVITVYEQLFDRLEG